MSRNREKAKKRLANLARAIIELLGSDNYGLPRKLNPELYQLLLETTNDRSPITGIRTLLLSRDWLVYAKKNEKGVK